MRGDCCRWFGASERPTAEPTILRLMATPPDITPDSRIFVSGHRGMVGSALLRRLQADGYRHLITATRQQLDLLDGRAVAAFVAEQRPDYIFIAAAKVGGIQANNLQRADFLHDNLMIEANLMAAAHAAGVQRLMFLGSSCIYPRDCPQPIREEYLLTGPLEPTNEPYAIAKIAGIKLADSYNRQHHRQYISVMPTNLYGPNDNYDLNSSHVLPALIRKAHEARERDDAELVVWGSGTPMREFLYVDDLADACVFLMARGYDGELLNIGTGSDVSIAELARTVMQVVGFEGRVVQDRGKPDGTPRKLLDVSRLKALGWTARTPLRDGIRLAYEAAPFFKH
jgi:GDP-L-fucose synthase